MTKTDYIYNARIINVVDGDTLDIELDLGFYVFAKERMRLKGVDTPELNSPDQAKRDKAQEAKNFVNTFNGQQVTLKSYRQDKYGRFLADIFPLGDTESISDKLLALGFAVPYNGGIRV